MTEVEKARAGEISPALKEVAQFEGIDPEKLRALVADGRVVINGYARSHSRVIGIGEGLSTKVNANIGTSPDHDDPGTREHPACHEVGDGTLHRATNLSRQGNGSHRQHA